MVASEDEFWLPCVTPEDELLLSLLVPLLLVPESVLLLVPESVELLVPVSVELLVPVSVELLVPVSVELLVPVSVLVALCSCPTHSPAPVTIATTSPPRLTSELVVHVLPFLPIVPPRLVTRFAGRAVDGPGTGCTGTGRTPSAP
ncbi:hypothetical protein [Curtobacterium luteum]|uniref:hypothetical protein n=1 Tax=Curtobacterium luteum TaxID=33881 RepID=UPI00381DE46F